jgi:hypothetical protein
MAKPDPETGLVIRFDYLWKSDKLRGWHEGGEHRPSAVVLVVPSGRVLLCGISRSPPSSPDFGVELDKHHKAVLGLKPDRQWIHCNEVNEISWDDPEIRPTPDGRWEYGYLGRAVAQEMLDKVRALLTAKQLSWIKREE